MLQGIEQRWTPEQANQGGLISWLFFTLTTTPIIIFAALVFAYFAINILSYWGTFLTLAAYAYLLNRRFINTRSVEIRRAVISGSIIAVLFIILSHYFAYAAFKNDLAEYLTTQQPGYLDVDWENIPDNDALYELYINQISDGELEADYWTSLRIRATGGAGVTLRGNKSSGTGRWILAGWDRKGFFAWMLLIIQLVAIFVACLGATLAGISMREVQLEDKFNLPPKDKQKSSAQIKDSKEPDYSVIKAPESDNPETSGTNKPRSKKVKNKDTGNIESAIKTSQWKLAQNYIKNGQRLKEECYQEAWLHTLLKKHIQKNNTEILEIILNAGLPLETVIGSKEQTILMYAAEYSRVECVELLLNFGADVYATDSEGNNVLYHADSWHYERSPNLIKKTKSLLQTAIDDPWRLKKQRATTKSRK